MTMRTAVVRASKILLLVLAVVLIGPEDPMRLLAASGADLVLGGKEVRLTGINLPQAGTEPTVNAGCGAGIDLDRVLAQLPPRSLVRVFFGQDLTLNATTGQRDWRGLDRVVAAAETSPSQPLLVVGLTNQWGICDGAEFKGHAWYAGGFRTNVPAGLTEPGRVPYLHYLHEVVRRYGTSPAIVMWEPVGEPEASACTPGPTNSGCYGDALTCPADASVVLGQFFTEVTAVVRRHAPGRLIGSAAIGGNQCGWAGPQGRALMGHTDIDVLTVHDFRQQPGLDEVGRETMRWAEQIGKPVLLEEIGLTAQDHADCMSKQERAQRLTDKINEAARAGADGWLLWAFGEATTACDMYIGFEDPSFALLQGPLGR